MSSRLLLALPLLAAACAPRHPAKPSAEGRYLAALAPAATERLVAEPISPARTWVTERDRGHPLVGLIWDVREGRFVDEAALAAAAAGADFLLLGETHDNPDHHLLQARVIRQVVAAGRRPALAFEMLSTAQQPAVDAAVAAAPRDADAFGTAVKWSEGWPDWPMYRPLVAAGLEAGLPIVGANLPRAKVREIVQKGAAALDPDLRTRLARDEPLPAGVLASLREEMRESHCGELPESLLDPLVLAQRARDAQMAARIEAAGAEGQRGAILVTGKGHARTDRGVPAVVAKDAPGKRVYAIAFVEADPDRPDPGAYAEEWGLPTSPFDALVFTPGAERENPCAGMRERMKKKRAAEKAAASKP